MAELENLPALERLDLARMLPLTDDDLTHLSTLRRLKQLTLYGPQITDTGLAHLTGLNGLEQLHLDYLSVTSVGVELLRQALPGCQIDWCGRHVA